MTDFRFASGFHCVYRHSVAEGEIYQTVLPTPGDLTFLRQTGERRKPLKWANEVQEDYAFMILNLVGTWCLRPAVSGSTQVLLPRTVFVATGNDAIEGLLGRGDHRQLILSWPKSSTQALSNWWAENAESRKIHLTHCPEDSLVGRVFDEVAAMDTTGNCVNLGKLVGSLAILTSQALSDALPPTLTDGGGFRTSSAIQQLIQAVRSNPAAKWSLKDAAHHVGYSPFHLSRSFKANFGYGFPEFVDRCRVERSMQILQAEEATMDELIAISGFASAQAMRDAFRAQLGLLPSELRSFAARQEVPISGPV